MSIRIAFLYVLLNISHPAKAFFAENLWEVSKSEIFPTCLQIYNKHLRALDSSAAFKEFENIEKIGASRNIPELKVYAVFLRGKYCYERHLWVKEQPLVYFRRAIAMPDLPDFLKAEILFHTGFWYYFGENNYPLAFENLLHANRLAEDIGYPAFPDADDLLNTLSVAYYQFGESEKAIKFLHLARQFPFSKEKNEIEIYNTLGVIYRDLDKIDSSIFYFSKALNRANELNSTAWVGIITGNLGSIYYKLKRYEEALDFLFKDYNLSTENKQLNSAANAVLLISQIYFEQGKIDSAYRMLQIGRGVAYDCNEPRLYHLLYKNLTRFYKYKGDVSKALAFTDSVIFYKDSIARKNDLTMLEKARNKIETETYLANIRLLESEKNKQILVRNGIIGIILLTLVIIWQTFRKVRLRQRKNLQILEIEQKRSVEELQNARALLDTYVESLKQKNQMLEQFTAEIEHIQSVNGGQAAAEKEEILKRLQDATILTDDDWIGFKKLFTKVNSDFFMRLNEKFPNLTQAEIRLLTLSKLGLSTKEKANMLGISPDSVRRTQQRLNKKLSKNEQEIFEEISFLQ